MDDSEELRAEAKGLRLTSLTTRSGTTVEIPVAGVLCVVGGNNVGKSQLLRDVTEILGGYPDRGIVLSAVEAQMDLPEDQAEEWFRRNSEHQVTPGQVDTFMPFGGGNALQMNALISWLHSDNAQARGHLLAWFVRTLDAAQRGAVATSSMSPPGMRGAGGAMARLYRDGALALEFSGICHKAFGFHLTLDRANADVRLRVGTPDVPSPPLQYPTVEYADAVAALPSLADQGDGVKNYLGMVLHLVTTSESVTIIDEPEAFLHPAQARALGRHLGTQAVEHDRQLLTATHDRDFVLGLLETECPITFLRLNWNRDTASAAALRAEEVKSIWDQPALRYSNVLQGLFHRVVVTCEGDADCRWYGAVLDQMGQEADLPSEEALFVPAGGKGQVPTCLAALTALEVQVFAILDFDAVLDPGFLGNVLQALRVDAADILRRAHSITNVVNNAVNAAELRARAKMSGLAGLPAGQVTQMATDLVGALEKQHVLIVPVGELESFDRAVGGHGPSWVSAALAANKHRTSAAAEAMLRPVLAAIGVGRSNSLTVPAPAVVTS